MMSAMTPPPPIRVGLPMFIGAAVLLGYWLLTRVSGIPLVMAVVATAWGGLWVLLQHRANQDTAREINAPPYRSPTARHVIVISNVAYHNRQGLLVCDVVNLLFLEGTFSAKPGDHLGDELRHLAQAKRLLKIDEVTGFTHRAALVGGGVIRLTTARGKQVSLRLKDPKALPLLMALLDQA